MLAVLKNMSDSSNKVENVSPEETEKWDSDPAGMMEYYKNQPYTLGQSIADIIDNSYDANATKIDVKIGFDPSSDDKPYIVIMDNGDGISEDEMKNALRLGVQRNRSETELGVFGIGMKLSSLAQANEVTIYSKKQGKVAVRRISASYIAQNNVAEVLKFHSGSQAFEINENRFIDGEWSTMILLEDLHGARRFMSMNKSLQDSLTGEIKKIKTHLGLTFQRVIEERSNVELVFNGKKVQPIDPFMPWENNPYYGTIQENRIVTTEIEGESVNVKIRFVIIPHTNNFDNSKRCKNVNQGYKKANDMQGLYLYRNSRLIQYGGWHNMYGDTTEEHNKLGKILIDLPSEYSKQFGLNPTKSEIKLPLKFLERVKALGDEEKAWGDVKRGKKMTFSQAFDYRYRNEGKKKKKLASAPAPSPAPSQPPAPAGGGTPQPPVPAPQAPSRPRRQQTISNTVKQVVVSIDETGDETVIKLDKSRDGYEDLMTRLRMWQIDRS